MTDQKTTLSQIQNKIDQILQGRSPVSAALQASASEATTRLLSLRFQALALAGDLEGCARLDEELASAIERTSSAADLWLLRACIAVKLHRIGDAQVFLCRDASFVRSTAARLLLADVHLQLGLYAQTKVELEGAIQDDATWDGYARLAYITALFGDVQAADVLYEAAQDELTAKEMQQFAWVELQRGFLFYERGDYVRAAQHYQRADASYSGYWLTGQRLAELLGARGEFARAMSLYQRLYAETPRPEWAHAMGDLLALAGDAAQAYEWRMTALRGYRKSADRGEVHYYHLLVDLCCELPGMTGDAVAWAHKDVALRSNHATEGDLAWALYRNGQVNEAREHVERALTFGVVSHRLFVQAGCIYAALNERVLSAKYMQQARAINPQPARAKFNGPKTKLKFELLPARTDVAAATLLS